MNIKKTPVRVAIDIETMSRRPNAVVLSIGLAAFSQYGVVSSLYIVLDQNVQVLRGRHVEQETMRWWERQTAEARKVFEDSLSSLATHPAAVHRMIDGFLSRFETENHYVEGVYGFGSDFDNATIIDLCREFSAKDPWHYKLNRCGRTMLALFPEAKSPETGTKHNAVDDATWLANSLINALNRLKMLEAYGV